MISDEAVQAVERVLDEPGSPVGWDVPRAVIRQALADALPHLPSVKDEMHALHCCGERREDCVYRARIKELEVGIDEQHERITELTQVVALGIVAIDLTRQYVGEERLPALDGWSWFDWTKKAERALITTELPTS